MNRKSFIRSATVGAVAVTAAGPDAARAAEDVAEDVAEASSRLGVGPEDTVVVHVDREHDFSAEEADAMAEIIVEATGCREVLVARGVVGFSVLGPGDG